MRSKPRSRSIDGRVVATWIAIPSFFVGVYLFVFHAYHYDSYITDLGIWLPIGSIAAVHYSWFYVIPKSKWNRFANYWIGLLIYAVFFFGLIQGQDAYESYQLENYGVSANGEVDLIYWKRGYKSTTETAVIHYYINTKRYVQEVNNEKYHLKIGERIQLRCSSQDPELFTMVFPQQNNLY